jgi:hypothetical protein
MTRSRLTATEILHGARAYSHNASRRAHQLSGPKRVRVMHEPIGDASRNDGIDNPCQHCGYQICNCGPCATCGEVPYYCNGSHAYEPAPAVQPIPAPPAEQRFKVGDRVRCIEGARGLARGAEYVVRGIDHDSCRATYLLLEGDGNEGGWLEERFEPAPIAEAPAVESDEAVLRRCGWTGRPGASFLDYHLADGTALWVSQLGASPSWFRSGGDGETHNAPTLLQAACAALGITLKEHSMRGLWAAAGLVGDTHRVIVGFESKCADAESCARAALLAYASRGKP